MVNRVILIGNLGADPDMRETQGGAKVAKISVATSENFKDKSGEWQTQTEWHTVILWRELAERAEKALIKGDQVYIEGKLTHRTWEDKDGNKRYTTEVVAGMFRRITKRETSQHAATANEPKQQPAPVQSVPDDDLPF